MVYKGKDDVWSEKIKMVGKYRWREIKSHTKRIRATYKSNIKASCSCYIVAFTIYNRDITEI
jgi:hypothetical protein